MVWLAPQFSSSSSSSSSEATDSPPVFSEGSRLVVRTQRLRDLLDLPPSAGVMPGEVRLVHLQPRPGLVAHVCVRSIDDGAGTCEADVETSEPKWTAALHCSLLAPQ